MVGVRKSNQTVVQADPGAADIKPYFIFNGWMVRKRTEKGNDNYNTIEIGDIVTNGVMPNGTAFSGEWLGDNTGNGFTDIDNYNSSGEHELNP